MGNILFLFRITDSVNVGIVVHNTIASSPQQLSPDTITCILKLCDISTIHRVMRVSQTWRQAAILVLSSWQSLHIVDRRHRGLLDNNSVLIDKRLSLRMLTRIKQVSLCKTGRKLSGLLLYSTVPILNSLHLDFSLTEVKISCTFPNLKHLSCDSADFAMLSRCQNLVSCTLKK